jgi:hypothetical protein
MKVFQAKAAKKHIEMIKKSGEAITSFVILGKPVGLINRIKEFYFFQLQSEQGIFESEF